MEKKIIEMVNDESETYTAVEVSQIESPELHKEVRNELNDLSINERRFHLTFVDADSLRAKIKTDAINVLEGIGYSF